MKVLVIDTVGGDRFSASFQSYFPAMRIRGLEMKDDGACQPHGYQCGYYAGVLLNLRPGPHEIVFARIFDGNGVWIPQSEDWMLEIIEKERPDIVTRSWGQDDADSPFWVRAGDMYWSSWVKKYEALQKSIGFVDFGAAGNDDKNDPDNDTSFPQRSMTVANVIGSHNRAGIPSVWSGDGPAVQCVMWGENIALNSNGNWERGSGTSFACPKAAGLCAYLGLSTDNWREMVKVQSVRPIAWDGPVPHVKWGYGSIEHLYQAQLQKLDPSLQPPSMIVRQHGVRRWHDRQLLS